MFALKIKAHFDILFTWLSGKWLNKKIEYYENLRKASQMEAQPLNVLILQTI